MSKKHKNNKKVGYEQDNTLRPRQFFTDGVLTENTRLYELRGYDKDGYDISYQQNYRFGGSLVKAIEKYEEWKSDKRYANVELTEFSPDFKQDRVRVKFIRCKEDEERNEQMNKSPEFCTYFKIGFEIYDYNINNSKNCFTLAVRDSYDYYDFDGIFNVSDPKAVFGEVADYFAVNYINESYNWFDAVPFNISGEQFYCLPFEDEKGSKSLFVENAFSAVSCPKEAAVFFLGTNGINNGVLLVTDYTQEIYSLQTSEKMTYEKHSRDEYFKPKEELYENIVDAYNARAKRMFDYSVNQSVHQEDLQFAKGQEQLQKTRPDMKVKGQKHRSSDEPER